MEELSALEKDTLAEVGNISLGASATALSTILDKFVDITTPQLSIVEGSELRQKYPLPCLLVEVEYISGLRGSNILLIKEEDAVVIAALMMGDDPADKEGPLNEIELSAVQEAMNQMMGSMATSMSELFQRTIEISTPKVERINLADDIPAQETLSADGKLVHVQFSMKVDDFIDSIMVQVIPVDFAREMCAHLLSGGAETASGSDEQPAPGPEAVVDSPGQDDEEETGDPDPGEDDHSEIETVVINTGDKQPEELSDLEKDTIAEVGNISLGASATALSTILEKPVDITTPNLDVRKVSEIQEQYPLPCLLVKVEYTSGLEGSNVLMIKESDAIIIAALMMGEDPGTKEGPLSEIEHSAVQEAMNQMMGSMSTSMSELFQRTIEISTPSLESIDLANEVPELYNFDSEEKVVHVEFKMKVADIIDSIMIQVIPVSFAKKMAGYLLYGESEPEVAVEEPLRKEEDSEQLIDEDSGFPETAFSQENNKEEQTTDYTPGSAGAEDLGVDMQRLNLVKDIPMDIVVVLGSARVPLGKLFSMDKGGIVDLDCNVNDPVEILANDKLLARGEVVMINDQLGVRITEIQYEDVIESYGL